MNGIYQRKQLSFNDTLKKDLLLLGNKLITKYMLLKYMLSNIFEKKKKSVKQSKTNSQQPKTTETQKLLI